MGILFDLIIALTPLPLMAMMADHQKRNMRDHLAAVQEIVAGFAAADMSAVEKAARRIGSSETMAQMCQHMGAGAAGFTNMALGFHRATRRPQGRYCRAGYDAWHLRQLPCHIPATDRRQGDLAAAHVRTGTRQMIMRLIRIGPWKGARISNAHHPQLTPSLLRARTWCPHCWV
ncbi:MAG: hypothetical protein ACHQ9S_02305 [Candidatus Binatia bacterium]